MLLEHYWIVATIKDGTIIMGYKLRDRRGQECLRNRTEVNELASLGYILNAKARTENGMITLKGVNCKLRELPTIQLKKLNQPEVYKVTHRIINNRKIIGYELISSKGVKRRVSIREGIELAKQKRILDVGVQKYSDTDYRLRGKNGLSLEVLPTISIKQI